VELIARHFGDPTANLARMIANLAVEPRQNGDIMYHVMSQ
jgi:hypothetical protein